MKERKIIFGRSLGILGAFLFLIVFSSRAISQSQPLFKLSVKDLPGSSRITMSSEAALPFSIEKKPGALYIEIETIRPLRIQQDAFKSEWIKSVGWSRGKSSYTFAIVLNQDSFDFEPAARKMPFELIIDLRPAKKAVDGAVNSPASSMIEHPDVEKPFPSAGEPAAERTAAGVEHKKFRSIVIDPGHGGIETGAKGKFGALEKNITLAISLKLKNIIEKNLAFRVFLTRDNDSDVSLENRSALANNHKADLFISIHANGSRRKNARGSETFFLSLNATDEEARRLAYLENASSRLEGQIEEGNQDDIKMILWDLAQSAYLKQSSRLAEIIQRGLNELLGTLNRGIKQAPFKVLTGVACPAVLVEVAFISNPEEEKRLQSEDFQDKVAQAIYQSLIEYLRIYP